MRANEKAQLGALDDMLGHSVEQWTQSLTFVNTFDRCALTVPRFLCLVVMFFRNNFKK